MHRVFFFWKTPIFKATLLDALTSAERMLTNCTLTQEGQLQVSAWQGTAGFISLNHTTEEKATAIL